MSMLGWLRTQVRVLEVWREDLASRPDIDLEEIQRVEKHYQWLTGEVARFEEASARAA